MPDVFQEDVAINRQVFLDHPKRDFTTVPMPQSALPTREEVEANLRKWGFERS
jgi:hypothetical protein